MVGRTRRDADALVAALGAESARHSVLERIAVSGVSKRVDRELRKDRTGRDEWRALDENSMAQMLDAHIGASIALLSHPNGRVRMAMVELCVDRAHQPGVLRSLVHRCTDRVPGIAALARDIVGAALAAESERSDGGALTTPVEYAVIELRSSADLVLQCPELVLTALELTATSSRPRRRLTLRATHQHNQLADHLATMTVTNDESEQARRQLATWLREQVSLFGKTKIDETE